MAGSLDPGWTVLASLDAAASPDDAVIASGTHAALAAASNAVVPFAGLWPAAPGDYYLLAQVAAGDDAGGADNEAASAAVTTITRPAVDYLPLNVTNMGGLVAGGALSGNFDLANSGTQDGAGPVAWSVFASPDNFLDGGDILVATGSTGAVVGGSATPDVLFAGTWPLDSGAWRLFVKVTADDDVAHGNDVAFVDCTLTAVNVNYVVSAVARSGGVDVAGGPVSGTFSLQNIGGTNGHRKVFWTAFANTTPLLDGSEVFVAAGERVALTAGQLASGIAFSGQWPAAAGSYHLLVRAVADDFPAGHVAASVAATPVQPSNVDYDVTDVDFPAAGAAGAAVAGGRSFTIRNIGAGAGTQPVSWAVYVSSDGTVSAGDTILCSDAVTIIPNIPFSGTWPLRTGSHYLLVRVSAYDDANHGNDLGFSAELTLVRVVWHGSGFRGREIPGRRAGAHPGERPRPGGAVDGTFQYTNIGSHAGTAALGWSVFASMNESLDASDVYIASGTAAGLAAGATSAAIPFSGTWPLTYGQYHLLVKITAADDLGTTDILAPTAIGLYDETPFIEPNSEVDLAPCIDLGVALKPGMRLRIDGSMDATDAHDIFGFDTGSAGFVTVSVHWTGAPGDARMFCDERAAQLFYRSQHGRHDLSHLLLARRLRGCRPLDRLRELGQPAPRGLRHLHHDHLGGLRRKR